MTRVDLQCRCGTMRGVADDVRAEGGNRIVCYCDDCQAFARFLTLQGGPRDLLDPCGGTEIVQLTPAQVTITKGADRLRLMRLSQRGLMRWFAGCCRSPVANTAAVASLPFVGLARSFMAAADPALDDVLGPVLARVHTRFATKPLPHESPKVPLGLIARSVRLLGGAWLRGQQRPSPFFEASTGAPVILPQVLTPAERDQLRLKE
jgi:hypothetical protein